MKRLSFVLLLFLGMSSVAQKEQVLMEVNGSPVYKSEFEQIYWKNKEEKVATKEDLDEYIELFTKFKLKVTEAEQLGLDTVAKFKKELAGYQEQLEKPYLVDSELNDELIQQAYYRTKNEVRASHILIQLSPNPSAEDTAKAYKELMEIKAKVESGKMSFYEAARKYSKDPSAKTNSGDLGYFTAFRMVYPFEEAAFTTEVGQISNPFKTRFGYHILKVTGKREGRGKVKVAHIMLRIKDDTPSMKKVNAEKKIVEIHEKLKKGEAFDALAKEYSEDRNSARKGGELNWIKSGETFAEFDSVSFALKENGDFSEPVLSPAGWHIIKRMDYKPVGDFESMKVELKNKIQRDTRSEKTKNSFVTKLKKEYGFVLIRENLEALKDQIDTSLLAGRWSADKVAGMKADLFSFADKAYTQEDFAKYLQANQRRKEIMEVNAFVEAKVERMITDELVEYERSQLSVKYPEFKALLKEYRDGILLFEITDQKVWSKAIDDTTGLKNFYEANKSSYTWPDRMDVNLFSSSDPKVIKTAYKLAKKGKIGNDSIANYLNKDSQLTISLESGRVESNEHELVKGQGWTQGLNKPKEINGKHVFAVVDNVLPAREKLLDEAKGKVTADYQEYLEKNWIEDLRGKYSVKVNNDVLYSIRTKP